MISKDIVVNNSSIQNTSEKEAHILCNIRSEQAFPSVSSKKKSRGKSQFYISFELQYYDIDKNGYKTLSRNRAIPLIL